MDETRSLEEAARIVPQTILDGQYRIERVIGEGSFGRVYLATDPRLRRPVAIKELLASRSTTDSDVFARYQDRFSREARAGGAITHPNVVTVYEMGIDPAQNTYLVMEYVDGTNLRDLLAQVGTLPQPRAVAIALDIARGLEALHEADIVHRDLKPANIMISRRGVAKVGDFGIAQVGTESERTQVTTGHPGTPLYMSPEQASGFGYVDGRSDLFSLGLVLYEMLVGEPYLRRRLAVEQARPETSPALAAMVHRLLEVDPNGRYPSASDLIADLSRLSTAPPPNAGALTGYPPPNASGNAVPRPYANAPGMGAPGTAGSNVPGYDSYRNGQGYGGQIPFAPGYGPGATGASQTAVPPYGASPPYGAPAPYRGSQPGPPPGSPLPYHVSGPPYAPPRRGLSTGGVFGIIGGMMLLLIVVGIALLAGSGSGNGDATATTGVSSFGTAATSTNATLQAISANANATGQARAANGTRGASTVRGNTFNAPTFAAPSLTVPFDVPQTARAGSGTPPASRLATPATTGGAGAIIADGNNRYSFTVPNGWQAQQSDNPSTDLEVIGMQPVGILRTVSQTTPAAVSLDVAAMSVIAGLKQANSTFMQVGPTQNATVNGQPAKRIEFTLTDEGVDLRGVMYVLTKGKIVVGIAFFAEPNNLPTVLTQTQSALDTFTFVQP